MNIKLTDLKQYRHWYEFKYTRIQPLHPHDQEIINKVIHSVCEYFNIFEHQLKGKKRSANLVFARAIAMKLIRQRTGLMLLQIGKIFNRDHTTVIHNIQTLERDLKYSPERLKLYEGVLQLLNKL